VRLKLACVDLLNAVPRLDAFPKESPVLLAELEAVGNGVRAELFTDEVVFEFAPFVGELVPLLA